MALIEKLEAIGDAIRAKTGGSEELTLDEMVDEIEGISGGGDFPEITFSNFDYLNYKNNYNWLFSDYSDKIILRGDNINSFMSTFQESTNLTDLSKNVFYITVSNTVSLLSLTFENTFDECYNLIKLPSIDISDVVNKNRVVAFSSFYNTFKSCSKITTEQINRFLNISGLSQSISTGDIRLRGCCINCFNLRTLPNIFTNGYGYSHYTNAFESMKYYDTFNGCILLDEINNLEDSFIVGNTSVNKTGFLHYQNIVANCCRLKDFTFKTDNGVPYVAKWSSMTLDFSSQTGWFNNTYKTNLLNKTNIGNDKKVTDAASYEALKNDPDWWTEDVTYSRYNHDSAVRTINSLPDFSTGSSNTIKFKGTAGSATDGGAINTLTAAEIAVATNKGWTVTLV